MRKLSEARLATRDRAAIEEAARRLRGAFPVEGIVLFGSKSRGDDDEESDIDLLVLTGRRLSRTETESIVALLYPIQLEYDVALSPLVVPAVEWSEGLYSVLPIHAEVEEQGVLA